MLVLTDLVSLLTGWLTLGFALLGLVPQLAKNYVDKPRQGGPSLPLLYSWLVGAICSTVGLFLVNGLTTQKAIIIWYVIGTAVLLYQKLYYEGHMPGTERYEDRKEAEKGGAIAVGIQMAHSVHTREAIEAEKAKAKAAATIGATPTRTGWLSPWLLRRHIPPVSPEHTPPRVGHEHSRPASRASSQLEVDHELGSGYGRSGRRGKRGRRGYVELTPGKEKKTRRNAGGHEVKEGAFARGFRWAFDHHNNLTQCVLLGTMCTAMLIVWIVINLRHKDTMSPLEHPQPPIIDGKWQAPRAIAGFFVNWAGTLCFFAPRIYQIWCTIRTKSTEGLAPWMFAILSLENSMAIASMLVVSRDISYIYAQSADLFGMASALASDFIFLFLHWAYRNNPPPPEIGEPWSAPAYVFPNRVILVRGPSLERDEDHRKLIKAAQDKFRADTQLHEERAGHLDSKEREIFGDEFNARLKQIQANADTHREHVVLTGNPKRRKALHKNNRHLEAELSELEKLNNRRGARDTALAASEEHRRAQSLSPRQSSTGSSGRRFTLSPSGSSGEEQHHQRQSGPELSAPRPASLSPDPSGQTEHARARGAQRASR